MRASALLPLTRHRNPGDLCVTSTLAALVFSLSACSSGALQAGHSLSPGEKGATASTVSREDSSHPQSEASTEPIQDDHRDSTTPGALEKADLAPKPVFEKLPPGGRLIGETGGIAVEAMSASGHWVATCQALRPEENAVRPDMPTGLRGEALQAFELRLTWGSDSQELEALLRSDESGRYLVVLQEGRAWLLDAVQQSRVDLSFLKPDLESDALPDHRSFAFAENGLVLLSEDQEIDAYLLPLPLPSAITGEDVLNRALPIEFGKRPVWRIDAGNGYATATSINEGQSSQAWPVPKATQRIHRCQGAVASYSAFPRITAYRPDRDLAYSWLRLPHQQEKKQKLIADPAPGYVMAHQAGWVRREDSGRLVHVSQGTQKQIASERCGARILHADDASGFFVAACEEYAPVADAKPAGTSRKSPPKYRFDLYLLRPGFVRSLSADTARTGVDVKGQASSRFVPLRPGSSAALVDLNERKLIALDASVYVLATGAQHALLRDEGQLKLWSPRGTENLDYALSSLSRILTVRSVTAIDDRIFLLGKSLSTWTLPAPPLALSPLGYALVPSEPASETRWARGPLLLLGPSEPENTP